MVSKNGWETFLINSMNKKDTKIDLVGSSFHEKYAARMAVLDHLGAKNFKIQSGNQSYVNLTPEPGCL